MLPHPTGASLRSLVLLATVVIGFVLLRAAERTPAVAPVPASLAQDLIGVWAPADQPANQIGGRLKFRTGRHWTLTHYDASGAVLEHFGGTYTVKGNEYVETIEYSSDENDPELKNAFTFQAKVEGDIMTQLGIGNPYTETWRRLR